MKIKCIASELLGVKGSQQAWVFLGHIVQGAEDANCQEVQRGVEIASF